MYQLQNHVLDALQELLLVHHKLLLQYVTINIHYSMECVNNVKIHRQYHVVELGHLHVQMVIIYQQENVYNVQVELLLVLVPQLFQHVVQVIMQMIKKQHVHNVLKQMQKNVQLPKLLLVMMDTM